MFAQIARMELEARERLADWMAHHLSCFDLAWPWKSWAHVAAQSREHPQRRFCESVVRRLLRSCFQKRVEDSLPEELRSALMPAYAMSANGAGVPGVNAKYLEDLSARARFAKRDEANDAEQTQTRAELDALAEVSALVKTKTPASAVVGWFQDSGARTTLGDATCAETLTAAALRHGQKCLTHHDVLLRRYAPALAEFQSSPEERETLAAGTAVTRARRAACGRGRTRGWPSRRCRVSSRWRSCHPPPWRVGWRRAPSPSKTTPRKPRAGAARTPSRSPPKPSARAPRRRRARRWRCGTPRRGWRRRGAPPPPLRRRGRTPSRGTR